MGDLGGLLRHRFHGIKAQRQRDVLPAEWVKVPAISGAVLCQSRFWGTPQLRERPMSIFYYRNILRSKGIEKSSDPCQRHTLPSPPSVKNSYLITTF